MKPFVYLVTSDAITSGIEEVFNAEGIEFLKFTELKEALATLNSCQMSRVFTKTDILIVNFITKTSLATSNLNSITGVRIINIFQWDRHLTELEVKILIKSKEVDNTTSMFTFNCDKDECISGLHNMVIGNIKDNVILVGDKEDNSSRLIPATTGDKLRIVMSSRYSLCIGALAQQSDELKNVFETTFDIKDETNTNLVLMGDKCIEEFLDKGELPIAVEINRSVNNIILVGISTKDVGTMKSVVSQIDSKMTADSKYIVFDMEDLNYKYLAYAVVDALIYRGDKTFILIGNSLVAYNGDTLLEYELLD